MRLTLPVFLVLALGLAVPGVAADKAEPFEIAHRGASGYLPEHTVEAVAMAHALGASWIEQDVVMSSDGVLVVLHDITLDATTDVRARFPDRSRKDGLNYALDFTLAELKTLEVRERFDPKTGKPVYPGRFSGELPVFRIATFEESLSLVQSLNASTGRKVGVYPEVKRPAWHLAQGRDLGAEVVSELRRFGYEEKTDLCHLQCFEYDEVRRLREKVGYRGKLVQLLGGGDKIGEGHTDFAYLRSPEGLRELARWVDGIGPPISEVLTGDLPGERRITSLVSNAREAGLVVHPYTARSDSLPKWASDYAELIDALAEAGVEGYFTDFPGLRDGR